MDDLRQALVLIEQAESLQDTIVQALTDGDSEQAEALCLKRQHLIESIPFSRFSDNVPPPLAEALQRLLAGNTALTAMTLNVQREIGQQLSEVQKGIAGSRTYSDINKHR